MQASYLPAVQETNFTGKSYTTAQRFANARDASAFAAGVADGALDVFLGRAFTSLVLRPVLDSRQKEAAWVLIISYRKPRHGEFSP